MIKIKALKRFGTWILLLGIFWGPWLIAWYWNLHPSTWPFKTMNQGQLLDPAFVLETSSPNNNVTLKGRWTLIYLNSTFCDEACQQAKRQVAQVITALAKDAPRVQQTSLSALTLALPVQEQLQQLPKTAQWILVDPHARAMLYYHKDTAQKALLKDLKRLLYVSQLD